MIKKVLTFISLILFLSGCNSTRPAIFNKSDTIPAEVKITQEHPECKKLTSALTAEEFYNCMVIFSELRPSLPGTIYFDDSPHFNDQNEINILCERKMMDISPLDSWSCLENYSGLVRFTENIIAGNKSGYCQ